MIYTNTQSSVSMTSRWACHTVPIGGGKYAYQIAYGPTYGYASATFSIALPDTAKVSRVWLNLSMNSPLSGVKNRTVNNIRIPYSGEVELNPELFTKNTKEYKASFSFQANGIVYDDDNNHSSVLWIYNPTLNIEYLTGEEEPDIGIDTEGPIDNDPMDERGYSLPRLLDANLVEVSRLNPDSLSLELNLKPLSTARMKLPPGEKEIKVRDFVELFAPSGSVGIYRVTEVEMSYGLSGGQEVYLEHALSTLADSLAIGMGAMSGSVREVFSSVLQKQGRSYWAMGECDVPDEYELLYEYTEDDLLKTVIRLFDMLPEGYALETNTKNRPFVLHIRKMIDDDCCECRLSRNANSVHVTMEDSDLCTRLYPFGFGDGEERISLKNLTGQQYMDADTISVWGTVEKTFSNDTIFDALTLKSVAEKYIERHKNPVLSIEIGAIDLFTATGEEIDYFHLGRICRVPIPEYGTVIRERVISKYYPDLYKDPENVVVMLANKIKDSSDEIAELMREASQSKLIGGTVETSQHQNDFNEITSASPLAVYFDITGYGNLLSARISYTCTDIDTYESRKCRITVDGNEVEGSSTAEGSIDIIRYLSTDENGVPIVGQHNAMLFPIALNDVEHHVDATVTLKTIEKKGGSSSAPGGSIPVGNQFYTVNKEALVTSDEKHFKVIGG